MYKAHGRNLGLLVPSCALKRFSQQFTDTRALASRPGPSFPTSSNIRLDLFPTSPPSAPTTLYWYGPVQQCDNVSAKASDFRLELPSPFFLCTHFPHGSQCTLGLTRTLTLTQRQHMLEKNRERKDTRENKREKEKRGGDEQNKKPRQTGRRENYEKKLSKKIGNSSSNNRAPPTPCL